jgi:hypothetical protein
MLSEQVLVEWWCLVAFMKAMNLLHWVMGAVKYLHTTTAIEMVNKVDTFCIVVLFAVALAATGVIQSK